MKRLLLASMMVFSSTALLGAQGPGPRQPGSGATPGPAGMGRGPAGAAVDNPAEFLIAQTGELKLTDAQVTRLAAIARRSAERRQSMRTQMDSMRTQLTRGDRPDSATRAAMRQRMEQMRPQMERLRDQSQADRRDAIAVLTPDQQAQAWERVARIGQARGLARGVRMGRGFAGPARPGMRARPMPGPGREQGFGPRRAGPPREDGPAPADGRRPGRPRPDIEN